MAVMVVRSMCASLLHVQYRVSAHFPLCSKLLKEVQGQEGRERSDLPLCSQDSRQPATLPANLARELLRLEHLHLK